MLKALRTRTHDHWTMRISCLLKVSSRGEVERDLPSFAQKILLCVQSKAMTVSKLPTNFSAADDSRWKKACIQALINPLGILVPLGSGVPSRNLENPMTTNNRHETRDLAADIEQLQAQNPDLIAALEMDLKKASTEFLERIAARHMDVADTQKLQSLLDQNDLTGFQLKLRNSTKPERGGSVIRCAYWALNDALSFFVDAISTTWRYVDLTDRVRYLGFTEAGLKGYRYLMSNLDAEPPLEFV